MQCILFQYFNTFGPGENSKGMYSSQTSKFIDYALKHESIIVFGDETQSGNSIYVKDNVLTTFLAFQKGKPGEEYNVGTGISTNFKTIASLDKEITGSDWEILHIPNPLRSHQIFTQADMTKTRRDLGFMAKYDLRSAIHEMSREHHS